MSDVILPKKWRQWCKANGLRPHCRAGHYSRANRNRADWLYLKGRGFVWRVNCDGMFQRGDRHEDFARWALCDIEQIPMPQNATAFWQFIEQMAEGV